MATSTFSGSAYNYGVLVELHITQERYIFDANIWCCWKSSTSSVTVHSRQLAMDLVKTSTLESKKVNKIYEGRVKNTGSCSMIPAVMPEMLESLFKDFPKQSGSTHTIGLPWDGTC